MATRTPVAFLCAFIGLMAVGRPAGQNRTTSILHANVVSVIDGQVLPNRTINIVGDTIQSVEADGPALAGAEVLDASGLFVIPGLWDMHAHLGATRPSSLGLYVANGVTGIRDMGTSLDEVLELRASTRSGVILGPRIVAAGPSLTDVIAEHYTAHQMVVRTSAEGRAAVQALKTRGVDFIKVHGLLSRDAYFAVAEEARRLVLPLVGHLPNRITLEEAIGAGQVGLDHLPDLAIQEPCFGASAYRLEPCRARFEGLARGGIWITPTLLTYRELLVMTGPLSTLDKEQLPYAARSLRDFWTWLSQKLPLDPQSIAAMRAASDVASNVARDLDASGVGIMVGCDVTGAPGFCVHDELALLVRGGMSPLRALQAATINPVRFLGVTQRLGTVAPIKDADLVLLEGNPLDDIANIKRIRAVVLRGRLLNRQSLDAILSDVRAAAQTE